MQIREALQVQGPSLALQRAAADEIARLDRMLAILESELEKAFNEIITSYQEGYRDGKEVYE